MGKPPRAYESFVTRHPKLGEAWDAIREAERNGPLDERSARLVKLAVAVGARQIGAVHSAVRKARATGVTREEMNQLVALAAATLGLPGSVAAQSWIDEEWEK